MEANCKNCDSVVESEYIHCPKCGQKTQLHRLTLHEVFHEILHYFTHADKGLIQLIRDLAVKNGKVAKEFMEGKRKKYYPPFAFFLLVCAIHVFVSSSNDNHVNVDVLEKYPEIAAISDSVKQAKWVGFYERREHGIHFININANLITMASVPISAFIFWLMYRRRKYNYTEHLVAGMFMFGFYTLIIAFLRALDLLFNIGENFIYMLCFVIEVAYFTIFYRNFMESTKVRAFFASFFSILTLFLISFIIMWIYMFNV